MNQLKIHLKDCHGIGELSHDFDFTVSGDPKHKQTSIIYAHNGIMKTSFAKTFDSISQGSLPVDHIHRRTPTCTVEADGQAIDPDSIFVVHSQNDYFESDKMMTLLADQATQERYVEIMESINTSLSSLLAHISGHFGASGAGKEEKLMKLFDELFGTSEETRLQHLISIKSEIDVANLDFQRINYKIINDPKVIAFLDKPATHLMLNEYVKTYESLISQSKYFSDALYDYSNAFDVQKSLKKNNFMKAKNRVVLVDKTGNEEEVSSVEQLEALYQADKDSVFANLELKQKYEKFDKEIGANEQIRGFQTWIKQNQEFIPLLRNQVSLKKLTWYAQLKSANELYSDFVAEYEAHKEELGKIYDRSNALESEWQEIVTRFNDSFVVPFTVQIRNKKDVILNRRKPELEFIFEDDRGGSPKAIDIKVLTGSQSSVLSKGESRALFILCVMFEIESRIRNGGDHLIVLDDIADSFDYKNKYAIIEYLHSLSEDSTNGVHMIVLTHNFDFFRAFRLRCGSWWSTSDKAYLASRSGRGVVTLSQAGSVDEFKRLKSEVQSNPKVFIALIPFARNLIEYARGTTDPSYVALTSCLHVKADTSQLTINNAVDAMDTVLGGVNLNAYKTQDRYQGFLAREVQDIINNGNEITIEHKIVLSIAIRLSVETYIQQRFAADNHPLLYESNQTGKWYGQFINTYGKSDAASRVLNRAMITTPESIHFNSFMYEPIMDLSLDELVILFKDVSSLQV